MSSNVLQMPAPNFEALSKALVRVRSLRSELIAFHPATCSDLGNDLKFSDCGLDIRVTFVKIRTIPSGEGHPGILNS